MLDRLQPTLPVLLANLASVGQVALTYQPDLEQLLVLLPQAVAVEQGAISWPTANTKQAYRARTSSFNLNLNMPPPCTTGFLPAQQQRAAVAWRTTRTARPATCTAGCRRTRRSTCGAPATSRA